MISVKRNVAVLSMMVATLGWSAFASSAMAQKAAVTSEPDESEALELQGEVSRGFAGAVFAMGNATADNRIVVYGRAADGKLSRTGSVSTRGRGIGVDTDTQGPLRLSEDHRYLYAVNPGSDDVSVFSVDGIRLRFLQRVAAGDQPLSITIFGNLLYVLNGSVAGNGITGFSIGADGTLKRLPNSFRALSSPIAVPGEVRFSPDGTLLLVTQKTTNTLLTPANAIDVFKVDRNGYASKLPIRNESFGLRPFSLAFRNDNQLVVVESFNAAPEMSAVSSYQLDAADGSLKVISGSVRNWQTDVCWILVTPDHRYAYASNFGSGTISSYSFNDAGELALIDGAAATFAAMSQPVDSALSADGHYIYQLLRGRGAVAALQIEEDGRLTRLGTTAGGLPVNNGASGLAAY